MAHRPTVLVAEDDPVFRRVIEFSIASAGFGCETASNGANAFARVERGDIDFLVTDHQMPICNGLELIQRLRAQPNHPSLPIVLCTAKGYELDTTELVAKYALLAVIRKPFSPKHLIQIIAKQLYIHSPLVFDHPATTGNSDPVNASITRPAAHSRS